MARAHPTLAMRPFLAEDTAMLAEIFRASILELTGDDYDEAQQAAWAATADDEEEFGRRLASRLTLIATFDGSPIGFAAMEDNRNIDMLYVHPAAVRQGVATMLCDALEKLAAARGTVRLTTDASDTARDFFGERGFEPQQRNTVARGDEWLVNTTMAKQLSPKGKPS
jgi:putative acetyltransferase